MEGEVNNPFGFTDAVALPQIPVRNISDISLRNLSNVVAAAGSAKLQQLAAETAALQATQQKIIDRTNYEQKNYFSTSADLASKDPLVHGWAVAKNVVANAWDTSAHMLAQARGLPEMAIANTDRMGINDATINAYDKYRKNPNQLTSQESALLNAVPKEGGGLQDHRSALQRLQEADSLDKQRASYVGDRAHGVSDMWGSVDRYNPYSSEQRDRSTQQYIGQGDSPLWARIKANVKNPAALLGDIGSLAPYAVGGTLTAGLGAGLQSIEDRLHSDQQFMAREGRHANSAEARAMDVIQGLNFGANFVENVMPVKALGRLGATASESALKGALTKSASIGGSVLANAGVTGFQTAVQQGLGSLAKSNDPAYNYGEILNSAVDGGMIAGAIHAAPAVAAGVKNEAANMVQEAKSLRNDLQSLGKADGTTQAGFEQLLQDNTFNPVKAVQDQSSIYHSDTATPEQQAQAQTNINTAISAAEDAYNRAAQSHEQYTQGQRDQLTEINSLLDATQGALASAVDESQKASFTKDIEYYKKEAATLQANIANADKYLTGFKNFRDETLKAVSTHEALIQGKAGETLSPQNLAANVDTLIKPSDTVTPDVQAKAVDHVTSYPMVYTPEQLRSVADSTVNPLSTNQRGLLRKLADMKDVLNLAKDGNAVTREIVDGGDGYRGLGDYMQSMTDAVRRDNALSKQSLLADVQRFEDNYTSKYDVAKQALQESADLAKQGLKDTAVTIYKDQEHGTWHINRGEITVPDSRAERAKYGMLQIIARSKSSSDMVDQIGENLAQIQQANLIMQDMANTPKESPVQQEPTVTADPVPPTGSADPTPTPSEPVTQQAFQPVGNPAAHDVLSNAAQHTPAQQANAQLHVLDSYRGDKAARRELYKAGDNIPDYMKRIRDQLQQESQARKQAQSTEKVKQETIKTEAEQQSIDTTPPENVGADASPDALQGMKEHSPDESISTDAEIAENANGEQLATIEPAGKLGLFDGLDEATRSAEMKLPDDKQNLVRTGFTQKVAESFGNPLVAVKDFMHTLRTYEGNPVDLLKDFLKNTELTEKQANVLNHFDAFHDPFVKAFESVFIPQSMDKRHYFREDFTQYLANTDAQGKAHFEANVLTAMAVSAYTWLGENAANPMHDAEYLLQHIIPTDQEYGNVPPAVHERFGNAESISTLAQALGKRAVQSLGLKVLDDVAPTRQGKLEASLGGYIIRALEKQGLLTIDTVSNGDMLQMSKGFNSLIAADIRKAVGDGTAVKVFNHYVSVTRNSEGLLHPSVQRIHDNTLGSQNVLNKLYGVESAIIHPLLEEPKGFNQGRIKNTNRGVPSLEAENLTENQKMPYRIRKEMVDLLGHMANNHQEQLLELLDLQTDQAWLEENVHVSRRVNEKAKRDSSIRALNVAMDFISSLNKDDQGEYQPIWMAHNVQQTQRMGISNNALNAQSSQEHRALVTPASYKVELKVDDTKLFEDDAHTKLTDYGLFLMSIGEHAEELSLGLKSLGYVGESVDKTHPRDFLPALDAWVKSDKVQQAIEAITSVRNKATSGEPITPTEFKAIKPVLAEMGMGIQSLSGLLALSELHSAKQQGLENFTTYIRGGSDGKTSGSAISFTASAAELGANPLEDKSLGFGLITKKAHEALGVNNQYEAAAIGTGDIYTNVNKYQTQRWGQIFSGDTKLTQSPLVKEALTHVSASMNALFGKFDKRAKGKTVATPIPYGSSTEAIKRKAAADNVTAVYTQLEAIGKTYKAGDHETAQQMAQALRNHLSNLAEYQRRMLSMIPVDAPFNRVYSLLEFDHNARNPDAPITGRNEHDFLIQYLKDADTKGKSIDALRSMAYNRYNARRRGVSASEAVEVEAINPRNALNYKLSSEVEHMIENVSYNVHGLVHEHALQDAYSKYLKTRDLNVSISNTAFTLYKEIHDIAYQELLDKGINTPLGKPGHILSYETKSGRKAVEGLSSAALQTLEKQLKKYMPAMVSPMSMKSKDPIGTGLMLSKFKRKFVKDDQHKVSISTPPTRGGKVKTTTDLSVLSRTESDPGVNGSVIPILSLDAAISNHVLGKFLAENMHDANYTNVRTIADMSKAQNQAFHDFLATYPLQVEMLKAFLRPLEGIQSGKFKLSPEAKVRVRTAILGLAETFYGDNRMQKNFNMDQFVSDITQHRYQAELNKLDYMDSLHTIQQYAGYGGELKLDETHQATRDAARKQLLAELNKQVKPESTGLPDANNPVSQMFDNKRQVTAVDAIAKMGNYFAKSEDATHKVYGELLSAIKPLLPKGLSVNYVNAARVGEHIQDAHQIKDGAVGWYSPKGNQVNILDSQSKNGNPTPEVLMHELTHAALTQASHMVQEGTATKEMAQAHAKLVDLHADVTKALTAEQQAQFTHALENVDEFIAYGLTNPSFQDVLAKTLVPRNGRKLSDIASAFKQFVTHALDLLFGKSNRSANRKNIPALEALVMDTAALSQSISEASIEHQQLSLLSYAMQHSQQQAHDQAKTMSTKDVYDTLNHGAMSGDFAKHVGTLMVNVVDKLTGYVNLPNDMDLTRVQPRSIEAVAHGFNMSDKEAYAVEAIQLSIDHALNNGAGSRVYKVLSQSYEDARKKLEPKDFYQGDWNHASVQDKAAAQAKYDYLFKPVANGSRNDTLARFAALAAAHEDTAKLLGFVPDAAKPNPKGIVQNITSTLDYVTSWLNNWLSSTNKTQTVTEKVTTLINRIADMEGRNRQKVFLDAADKSWEFASTIMGNFRISKRNLLGNLGQFAVFKDSKWSLLRAGSLLTKTMASRHLDKIPGTLTDLRNLENPNTPYGAMAETLNELRDSDPTKKTMIKLLRGTKAIEQQRSALKGTIRSLLKKSFGQELTKDETHALTYALVRSGAHALLGTHSIESIHKLLADPKERINAMRKLETEISKHPKGNAILNRTAQLGWHMLSGDPLPGLAMNAAAIVHQATQGKTNDPALIKAVDQLATLHSFNYLDTKRRNAATAVMERELNRKGDAANGVEVLLKLHDTLHNDAMGSHFKDNPLSAIKGWVPEITNPYRETRVVTPADAQQLEKLGWKSVGPVPKDASDPSATTMVLMMNPDGGYQRRVSGTFGLVDSHTKGTVITDGKGGELTSTIHADMLERIKRMEATPYRSYDPRKDESTQLVANLDTKGDVINYSYRMSAFNRDTQLQRNNDFAELLGEYASNNVDKVQTPKQNVEILKALHEDFLENYAKNSDAYVEIGPKALDAGARDLWRMLPYTTQKAMADVWGKGAPMYIRNDLITMTFGYRKLSLGTLFDKAQSQRNFAENMYVSTMEALFKDKAQLRAYQIGRATVETVKTAKDFIVMRTLSVLWENIKANAVLLAAMGVNPIRGAQYAAQAIKGAHQYQKDQAALLDAEQRLRAGIGDANELNHRIAMLQDSLARNPLAAFINEGMMPSIVDDIELTGDDYGYKSALGSKYEAQINKIPKSVRTVGKWVMVSPDTAPHKLLSRATQLADFAGRFVLYKHLTEHATKKLSHDDAIHEAVDAFINYDLPSSPQVQWLNDVGGVFFTKFLLRYQHVLIKVLRRHPALVATQSMALHTFTDTPTVTEPFLLNKIGGVWHGGPLALPGAILGSTSMKLLF